MIEKERKEGFFYTASISGGKDSICMGLLLIERGYPVDDFIFFDMGVEYPETYDAIAKFERDIGRKVARVTPPEGDFWFYACEREYIGRKKVSGIPQKGYGFPIYNCRWCTNKKQEAISSYQKLKGYTDKNTIQYIGIAADEPKRIRNFANKRYPLYEWGITEADALNYCRSRGYYPPPNPYDHHGRVSCYCCPFSNQKQIEYLIEQRPELWQIIKDHEIPPEQIRGSRRFQWKLKGTAYFEKQLKIKRENEQKQLKFDF